jgi:hypothetical protein
MKRLAVILSLALLAANKTLAEPATIVCPTDAPAQVKLAAKELRRYVYLRTGELPTIENHRTYSNDRTYVSLTVDPALGAQEYRLKSAGQSLAISGGSPVAVLYGAYALAEKLGVRFYLHGDVVPYAKIQFALPKLDETRKPIFETRGIQPFHDFPEGPDWWTTEDYRAYIAQVAKMRMNFIGFHNYPGELLLWHGVAEDVNPDGTVKSTYPSNWFSNARSGWGYAPLKTGDFTAGANQLFAADNVFSEVAGSDNRHFDRVAKMLGTIVADSHALGIKVAVGTETPLRIPGPVQARLKALGKTNAVEEVYKGTFAWLMKNAPVDYYWAWTPEGWIWSGNTPGAYKAVENDLKTAQEAAKSLGNPFPVGTCGWVLGPQQNRAAWDQMLAKEAPIANINPLAGHAPIDPSFSDIKNRPKWAIPWLENDPDMIAYQPWVKRTRYDAVDAQRRGCTGLMGIHWRTKILSANLSALAQAGWDQSWARQENLLKKTSHNIGTAVAFAAPVEGTEEDAVYQTLRFGLQSYPVEVPNGTYKVTLKFNEPHHDAAGKRVFTVKVQNKTVAEHLDVFAKAGGKNRVFDLVVPEVSVTDYTLDLSFVPEVEYPFISGIEISGMTAAANQVAPRPYARKINIGGPACADFEADAAKSEGSQGGLDRAMPADDFYRDFAAAQFGETVAEAAGKILADADGFTTVFNPKYPTFSGSSEWSGGPGGLRVIREPWEKLRDTHYAFAGNFAALRPQVKGIGNLERFDYWMNTLSASAKMVELACRRGALDMAIEKMNAEKDPTAKKTRAESALALRRELVRGWEQLMTLQIQLVSTPGELGTIANLELHTRNGNHWLTVQDKAIAAALGAPLPADCAPAMGYTGPGILRVTTVRGSVAKGEALQLPIIALDKTPVKSVVVKIRPLGKGDWQSIAAKHLGRAVWQATLPAATDDFEYQVEAETANGKKLAWPPTAPQMNQTVVITE